MAETVAFASPEWVDIARTVLEEVVAEHGETGKSFSVCEVFTDAPPGMAGPDATTAAWHFRIVDKTVTVGEGEIAEADMNVRLHYGSALPLGAARLYAGDAGTNGGQSASGRARTHRRWFKHAAVPGGAAQPLSRGDAVGLSRPSIRRLW